MTAKQTAMDLFDGDDFMYVAQRRSIRRLPQGYVIETPDCVLWGFPVRYDPAATHYRIEHHQDPDTWLVWLCAGTIRGILDLIPYPLPRIMFARDNRLRTYKFQTITSKLMKWHNQPEQQHQLGGGKPAGPTKTQRENDMLNNQLLKQQLAQKPAEIPAAPVLTLPPAPKYAPPPQQTSQDTDAAAREVARANRRRRGFQASRLGAGNTGATRPAASPSAPSSGTKTTLG